jgi:4-nitrophenyl phosphatase
LFVTNNSMSTIADQEAALEAAGVPAAGDVVTSAEASAFLVGPGERVLIVAGQGVDEAVRNRGAAIVDGTTGADVVIVGLHHGFDYPMLRDATRAIRSGARFVATNDDATFPTPDGLIPGAGSIVAAVATAAGVTPTIAGKPYRPMADLVAARCGADFEPGRALVVGDRGSTDGRFAATVGCPFALVRSGVTPPGSSPDAPIPIAVDASDLAAVADVVLSAPTLS